MYEWVGPWGKERIGRWVYDAWVNGKRVGAGQISKSMDGYVSG